MKLTDLRPMLEVSNMDEALAYYQDVLGFSCTGRMNNFWALVEKDEVGIMFSSRTRRFQDFSPTLTGSLYLYTDTVDSLWEEWKEKIALSYPLDIFDYGMKDSVFNGLQQLPDLCRTSHLVNCNLSTLLAHL